MSFENLYAASHRVDEVHLKPHRSGAQKRGSVSSSADGKSRKRTCLKYDDDNSPLEVVTSPVVCHLLRMLYGFPFNTSHLTERALQYMTVRRVNQRYIGVNDIEGTPDVIIVKSPMGSGKTTLFAELINEVKRVLVITSRKTYCDHICSVIPGLQNYQQVVGKLSAEEHPRLAVQLQSLGRIKNIKDETTYAHWDLVYIDEIDSVVKECTSSLSGIEARTNATKYLRKLVSNIPRVVVTDAGLAPWHVEILTSYLMSDLNWKSKFFLINDSRPASHHVRVFDRCALSSHTFHKDFLGQLKHRFADDGDLLAIENILLSSKNTTAYKCFIKATHSAYIRGDVGADDAGTHLFDSMLNHHKNMIVVCNTKIQAMLVKSVVKRAGISAFLLTGDTATCKRHAFMANPKEYLDKKKIQCFIYTTCFKVGVDLNFDHFSEILMLVETGGAIWRHTPPLIDMFQSVGRARRVQVLNVFVHNRLDHADDKIRDDMGYINAHTAYCDKDTSRARHLFDMAATRTTNCIANGTARQKTRMFIDDPNTMMWRTYLMTKEEKYINRSPRLFFDTFMSLLNHTIGRGDVEIVPVIVDPETNKPKRVDFFPEEDDHSIDFVLACKQKINSQLTQYTAIDYDALKDMMTNSSFSNNKKANLRSVLTLLQHLSGTVKNLFALMYRLSGDKLLKWAVDFHKLSHIEPSFPVNMAHYEEELAMYLNPADLLKRVTKCIFSNNKVTTLRTYEEFMETMALLKRLVDATTIDEGDPMFRVEVVDPLSKYLVNEYEVSVDLGEVLTEICQTAGLMLMIVNKGTFRVVFPSLKDTVDVNKMCALLML